jgi:hypothetical protein
MVRKIICTLTAAAGLAIMACPSAVLAVGPGWPAARLTASPTVEPASFWGLPFPYGYRWRRHPECLRFVPYQDYRRHLLAPRLGVHPLR